MLKYRCVTILSADASNIIIGGIAFCLCDYLGADGVTLLGSARFCAGHYGTNFLIVEII